ncbi:MAG: hypothetical protein PHF00_02585 [Elusimicrobia bacterium]|nr:hypothetical protein [Elusimicrobiota bacterium]
MKFWVYINGEVPWCFTPEEISRLPGFAATTLACPAEGEILEKNWRRAGEFQELMPILHELDRRCQPAPPPAPPDALDVDKLLDSAGNRLFSHVADLMKELETRREEKGLVLALQRQILDLKDQLQQARDHAAQLENRLPRITELEASARKNADRIQALETALATRDGAVTELRIELEKAKNDLEAAKRRGNESANDLSIRNRLVDKLNRDLTEKEVSLAKALGLIRRMEEDLERLCPKGASPAQSQSEEPPAAGSEIPLPAEPSPAPAQDPKDSAAPMPRTAYTTDEPPALPEIMVPPPPGERPQAHNALMDLLKKIVNKPEM